MSDLTPQSAPGAITVSKPQGSRLGIVDIIGMTDRLVALAVEHNIPADIFLDGAREAPETRHRLAFLCAALQISKKALDTKGIAAVNVTLRNIDTLLQLVEENPGELAPETVHALMTRVRADIFSDADIARSVERTMQMSVRQALEVIKNDELTAFFAEAVAQMAKDTSDYSKHLDVIAALIEGLARTKMMTAESAARMAALLPQSESVAAPIAASATLLVAPPAAETQPAQRERVRFTTIASDALSDVVDVVPERRDGPLSMQDCIDIGKKITL